MAPISNRYEWVAELVGLEFVGIDENRVKLSSRYTITMDHWWRYLRRGALRLSSFDHQLPFAWVRVKPEVDGEDDGFVVGAQSQTQKEAGTLLDAGAALAQVLVGKRILRASIAAGTADLTLDFGDDVLQVLGYSGAHEAWVVNGPDGYIDHGGPGLPGS